MILDTAAAMLDELPLGEISLRELARRVGLAKSNVVRYFPTREAVFLAVLADDWAAWLDELAELAGPVTAGAPSLDPRQRLAAAIAQTLAGRRRLCGLIAAAPTILERNIPVETAREFKAASLAQTARLGGIVTAAVPALTAEQGFEVAGVTWPLTTGAWPMANPGPAVAQVLAEPGFADLCIDFGPALARVLTALLDGMAAQAGGAGGDATAAPRPGTRRGRPVVRASAPSRSDCPSG